MAHHKKSEQFDQTVFARLAQARLGMRLIGDTLNAITYKRPHKHAVAYNFNSAGE